jgi:alanyl-tRNA synthetase
LTALILREKGWNWTKLDLPLQCKNKKIVLVPHLKFLPKIVVLIPGNVEKFVGYDQTENEVKSLVFEKWIVKKDGILYQIVLDNTHFIQKVEDW